jgi:phosphoglycerate dehydrogenase-like enzyme
MLNLPPAPLVEILITLPFSEEIVTPLRQVSPSVNLTLQVARRPEDVSSEIWQKTQILYTDRVLPTPDLVPALRWLQFHSAGIDFAVGSPLLQKPNLAVTTLSGAAAPQAAEYTLAMMLGMAHRLPDLFSAQNRAEWPRERWERYRPRELFGSTLAIIGYGSIGRELARLVQPFGMTVLAVKHDAMHPEDRGYSAEGHGDPNGNLFSRLYPFQALQSVLKLADFVVVTTPLTPLTSGLLGEEELAALKPGACLVVVGRGGVVDENALLQALQERRVAAAALDVFQEEPLSPTSPLWKQPNLIVTPHVGGLSSHYDERAMQLFAANLARFLKGDPLFNRFDSNRGY